MFVVVAHVDVVDEVDFDVEVLDDDDVLDVDDVVVVVVAVAIDIFASNYLRLVVVEIQVATTIVRL